MKRALLYRRGGLGDTLLTFPVAEVLNRLGYQVIFFGHSDYLYLAKRCGWAQAIYSGELLFPIVVANVGRGGTIWDYLGKLVK